MILSRSDETLVLQNYLLGIMSQRLTNGIHAEVGLQGMCKIQGLFDTLSKSPVNRRRPNYESTESLSIVRDGTKMRDEGSSIGYTLWIKVRIENTPRETSLSKPFSELVFLVQMWAHLLEDKISIFGFKEE